MGNMILVSLKGKGLFGNKVIYRRFLNPCKMKAEKAGGEGLIVVLL